MQPRHLNHQLFTAAAIDDIIARGRRNDWAELRGAALEDPSLFEKIEQVCRRHADNPYAQRYHFWMHYLHAHRSAACEHENGSDPMPLRT